MSDEILLNEAAYAVWQTVKNRGPIELGEVAKSAGVDQSQVSATATDAALQGFFSVQEREREELTVADSARGLIEAGLAEFRTAHKLQEAGGKLTMSEAAPWAKSEGIAINDAIKWGTLRGAIERVKTENGAALKLTDVGRRLLVSPDADLRLLNRMDYQGSCYLDKLTDDDEPKRVVALL